MREIVIGKELVNRVVKALQSDADLLHKTHEVQVIGAVGGCGELVIKLRLTEEMLSALQAPTPL